MLKRFLILALILLLPIMGCATTREIFPDTSKTKVDLSQNNYRLVKANAIGVSKGIKLLCLIPVSAPRYIMAMENLYKDAGIVEGKAYALTNIVEERTNVNLLLFSIPKIRIRADVIEFTE